MNNTAATNTLNTRPAIFDFNRKGRGTYDGDTFIFHRGNQTDKGTNGKLEFISRKGGNHVIVKAFLDTDGNGRFSRDELIFKGSSSGEDLADQLRGSTGRIEWNLDDCTPCLKAPISRLILNPKGDKSVEFFETSRFYCVRRTTIISAFDRERTTGSKSRPCHGALIRFLNRIRYEKI